MALDQTDNLAAKHRPVRFADVVGAQTATVVLKTAARNRLPPQQILLSGGSGVGKTTLARIFAAALFCPNATDGEPCGTCDVCLSVTGVNHNHPDVIEVDAAASGGVDNVRALAHSSALVPSLAPWRVHIIDEAHGLTKEGAGAFLRLLEEPPAHAIFILATTDPHKLPPAVRGRCIHLPVVVANDDDKTANLRRICEEEHWSISDDVLATVVDVTDPELGVRGTVANLAAVGRAPDVDAYTTLGAVPSVSIAALFDAILDHDTVGATKLVDTLLGVHPAVLLHIQLVAWSRRKLRNYLHSSDRYSAVRWLHIWSQFATASMSSADILLATIRASREDLSSPDGTAALVEAAEEAAQRLSVLTTKATSDTLDKVNSALDSLSAATVLATQSAERAEKATLAQPSTHLPPPPDTAPPPSSPPQPAAEQPAAEQPAAEQPVVLGPTGVVEDTAPPAPRPDTDSEEQPITPSSTSDVPAQGFDVSYDPVDTTALLLSRQDTAKIYEDLPKIRLTVEQLRSVATRSRNAAALLKEAHIVDDGQLWTILLTAAQDWPTGVVAAAHLQDLGRPAQVVRA